MISVAVDIQGADSAAGSLTDGVAAAIDALPELFVYLCGDKAVLSDRLKTALKSGRLEIVDAPQIITNSEKPIGAIAAKKNSSLVKGMELCASGKASAFATCGATGALFVAAMMMLEKIVKSPTLAVALKKSDGAPFCIADCGANVDCRPERFTDFARIGCAYMRSVGAEDPRVALLSNGAEAEKGNKTVKEAHALLKESGLNFTGNVEGSNVLNPNSGDVIVCDGFSGNILLKTIEGAAKTAVSQALALAAQTGDRANCGALEKLYKEYDYTTQGGAMLLGFKTPIVKGHGAANAETFFHIIESAYALARSGITEKIIKEFKV